MNMSNEHSTALATLALWQQGQPLAPWLNTLGKLPYTNRPTILATQGHMLALLVDNAVRLGHLPPAAPDNPVDVAAGWAWHGLPKAERETVLLMQVCAGEMHTLAWLVNQVEAVPVAHRPACAATLRITSNEPTAKAGSTPDPLQVQIVGMPTRETETTAKRSADGNIEGTVTTERDAA